MSCILLVDNGSLRAAATLQLRVLAERLSEHIAHTVFPVSLQHADKIDADKLDGVPASTFTSFMTQQLTDGEREFIVLPLFFGKSRALSSCLLDEVDTLRQQFDEFHCVVADELFPLSSGEDRLADILLEHIKTMATVSDVLINNVVLVDHGSPLKQVTAVRERIAEGIQSGLPEGVNLEQAVMERRAGKEYDFNGILLADWLRQKATAGESSAIVVLLFLLPGRHAGEGGDIETICENVKKDFPGFDIAITPLVGEHPVLISILTDRFQFAFNRL